ncbi:MAG: type I polyketide synthase, partial [Chloroflexi bacterium]|nr:type I polyketide synthase [Chloroflexota bacterium]
VHLACQSLLSYQSDMVLAGGVSISVPQQQGYLYQEGGTGSPDGHCRAFDANASGTIKGNGVGIVVLKRLADAIADGDTIHALIKGSAINNDGALKIGFTAPSQDGQAEVLDAAYAAADVAPDTIGYIEGHGTATPLGDPIEVAALTQVFRKSTDQKQFCALGSVKSNIGHLDAAAGVTGLIKATLAVKHGQIPPTLHYTQPNPNIDFANSPFYVNNALQQWDAGHEPRRAGVSAFGIGGTNAHVVLEEPPTPVADESSSAWQLLVLSAKSPAALDTATARLADHLAQHPELDCADIAYTSQVGRQAFRYRRIAVCEDRADGERALRSLDPRFVVSGRSAAMAQPVVFMFPGGGAQYPRMGAELYATEPVFRAEIDRCAELLRPHLADDLRSLLYANADDNSAKRFERPALALPALFATEYALARLWMAWGVQPNAMIGHSLGEYVAACLAGVLRLEDALALVALRGQLFEQLPVGGMLSVPLSEAELRRLLTPQMSIAAINGPQQCVVAGPTDEIGALEALLTAQGLSCRRLPIAVAAHSRMVEPILRQFEAFMRTVPLQPPTMRYLSNVTGDWAEPAEVTRPDYWVRHLRETVRFGQSIDTLLQLRPAIFVEVGPGQTLSTLTRLQPGYTPDQVVLSSLRHPHNQQGDRSFILTALGRLWLAGVEIDWTALHAEQRRRRVPLPTYPFERQRYWIERHDHSAQQSQAAEPQGTVPLWKQALLPPTADTPDVGWLVFTGRQPLDAEVTAQLRQQYRDVVQVEMGASFAELGPRQYRIDPHNPDSFRT